MPEDQKPFVHRDGSATPPVATDWQRLLTPDALKRQIRETRSTRSPDAERTLQLLLQPPINATVATMTELEPVPQAVVSSVAIALARAGTRRHRLLLELRAVLEAQL